MKPRRLSALLVLVLILSACNLPSNAPVTEKPTLAVTASPTLSLATAAPTLTLPPSNTPPPAATSTPSVPVAFPARSPSTAASDRELAGWS